MEDDDDHDLLYDSEGNILRTRSIREFFASPRDTTSSLRKGNGGDVADL